MTKNSLSRIIYLICLGFLTVSCNDDPSTEQVEKYQLYFENGSAQRYLAGEEINVVFRSKNLLLTDADSVKLLFETLTGGGSAPQGPVYTDKSGRAELTWKLGPDSFLQVLRASVYKPSGEYLTYKDLRAFAFSDDVWQKISGDFDGQVTEMITDTVEDVTFMISVSKLYRQSERYFEWEEVRDQALGFPRTIDIDRNRVIYLSTWSGDVVKSTDHGLSWQLCTKPYPENPYYIYMHVSNDNYLWVFKFDYPTKVSKDGGITWTEVTPDLTSSSFGNIFRLKNGTLFYHGSNCCSLSRSDDDGLTWTHITTPGSSHGLYVNDEDELFIFTQETGFSIYKSTDMGQTFVKVHSVSPEWYTSVKTYVIRWDNFYYIMFPGFGILKSYDLENYTIYWQNASFRELFINHNGILIANDLDHKSVYYRRNSE